LALSGNVLIENKSIDNPSIISTNYMEINPNTLTIATNRDVFITINNNTIQAQGLNAQLRENKLNFSSSMTSNTFVQ
jgi:LPS export ABC transporter protein LptC